MNILTELRDLSVSEAWLRFENLCSDCVETQLATLESILTNAASSEIGREFGFAEIADFESYRNAVPISSWPDYEERVERMMNGERGVLFPGAPVAFISTSGTSGRPKMIPESETGALAKNLTDKLRRAFTFGRHPEMTRRKILPLVNPAKTGVTPGGTPFGPKIFMRFN